jgi:diguanylate cyclase
MDLHPPTLHFVCLAVLLLAAGAMTWLRPRQHHYRGHAWWVAGQWLLLAGWALQWAWPDQPHALLVAHALVLQWPIAVLAGLRRFYSRHGLPVPVTSDLALLLLAALAPALLLVLSAPPEWLLRTQMAGLCVLPLYAAVLVARTSEFRDGAVLPVLCATLATLAVVPSLGWFGAAPHVATLVMLLAALVLTHVTLLLNFQRTELTWLAEQRKLHYLADMDILTRVPNRRHFQELAAQALGSGVQADAAALLMFDIDHFRRINEMFGSAAGDEALRQVSHCMRETLRENDVAGRLAGDQFSILLPDTTPKGAMAVAARIVGNLAAHQVAPRVAPLSLSFGVVALTAGEGIGETLRRAEQALHEAKRQGRSRVVIATGPIDRPVFTNSRTLGLLSA